MNRIDKLLIQFENRSEDHYFEGGKEVTQKGAAQEETAPKFNWFPTKMWKTKSKAVKEIRKLLVLLMLGHVALIVVEIAFFKMISAAIWEVMYLWLAYYSFMTMTSIITYFYSVLLIVACGMNAMNIFAIMGLGSVVATLGFPLQLAFYGFGGYHLFWRQRAWANANKTEDLSDEKPGDAKAGDVEKGTPTPTGGKSMEDKVASETGKHLANGLMKAAEQKSGELLKQIDNKK